MSRGSVPLAWLRRHRSCLAIGLLALAWGLTMHAMGWAQSAHFAQVRALAAGHAEIDPWHWETRDKAWVDGHFYSVKAPGVALVSLPAYAALDAAGARTAARRAAANARETPRPQWVAEPLPPYSEHGFSERRAVAVGERVERTTPLVWALTLLVAVLPAAALLVIVRRLGDRFVPGYGTAAAVTLGLGTIVMTFAAQYFSHVIAAALAFAAFAVLARERRGPPRTGLVAAAGLLAGLAVVFEYPVGLVGVVLFFYAASRAPRVSRALAYAGCATAGALPVFAFNQWAFGSPLRFAYGDAVAVQGETGHDVVGLNDDGLFGITLPDPAAALELLFAGRGLVTLTPVVLAGVAGAVLLRREHRAEANVILGVAGLFFVYNAAYWLPFGGGTPGPRFLLAALPFLALGMAAAYRRWPAVTLALAIPSALFMVLAAITFPLIGDNGTWLWVDQLRSGVLEHTVLTAFGVGDPWVAIAPVLLAAAAAAALAASVTPLRHASDFVPAAALLAGWGVLAVVGPTLAGDEVTPLDGGEDTLIAIGAALAIAAGALLALRAVAARGARGIAREAGGGVDTAMAGAAQSGSRRPPPSS